MSEREFDFDQLLNTPSSNPSALSWLFGTAAFILICCSPVLIFAVWRWAL